MPPVNSLIPSLGHLVGHTVGVDDLWLGIHDGNLDFARLVRTIPQGFSLCERNLLNHGRFVKTSASVRITGILNKENLIGGGVPGDVSLAR